MTNIRLHNVDGKELKRSIELSKIKALTRNTEAKHTNQFVVHVQDEYDYEFFSDDVDLIFKHIIEAHTETRKPAIPIYGVHGKLSNYITSQKNHKEKQVKGLPPDDYLKTGSDAINPNNTTWSASSMKTEKGEKPAKPEK